MTTGGRKDNPKPRLPSADQTAPDDGLLTSDDLFGDMVDAPAHPREAPPLAARTAPIRVQVTEPGVPGKAPTRGAPKAGEVLPEDVAALLDAFSEPAEAVARAQTASAVPPPPPEPPVAAAPSLLEPIPAQEPDLLEALIAPEPHAPDPPGARIPVPGTRAAPATPPSRPSPSPPRTRPAPPVVPSPPEERVRDLLLDEGTPAPPWVPAARKEAPSPSATTPGIPVESLLDLPEMQEIAARGAVAPPPREPPPPPASRLGTKFQAARPNVEPVQERVALDLAALAEDAMADPAKPLEPPPRPARGEQTYGPYRLLEKVAVGGMAEVFKAKRSGVEGFEKVVAVKRILAHLSDNKEFLDMFIDEAKMVAGLTHPNIVQIFDLGRLEKSYYIAMEFVHGRDLRSIMKRGKDRGIRIPLDLSVHIVSRVCAALEYAHRAKDDRGRAMRIVHRDVSPQNILISFEGDVKLTDFGIAKAATKASTTERGALRGKLLYMSPEQAWGKAMDRRSDLFSLGIVLYEMITDQKPFLAQSEMSILEMVRDCRVAPPTTLNPRIPERLEKVVVKALEKDPEMRYQDAAEMARDLERALPDRKAPTATELAKFMEVLFEQAERGEATHDEHGSGDHGPGSAIEIEFERTPSRPAGRREPPPAEPAAKDISIDKLLKRFGIK